MRRFVQVVAVIAVALGCIGILVAVILFFLMWAGHENDIAAVSAEEWTEVASLIGSGLAIILFSGMAWILVEIANKIDPQPKSNSTSDRGNL
jgi:heme/copper-type cytochrome/quinol oxidase subunit 2